MSDFRSIGSNVTIHPLAKIIGRENIVIGSNVIIDDFVFIGTHKKLVIGNYVHISSHASIVGGGECLLCDFSSVSTGVRILSGTDEHHAGKLLNSTIPAGLRAVARGRVVIGPHAGIGANTVILPNTSLGEGAIVGACALVAKDLAPWGVYAGSPARFARHRKSAGILAAEQELLARHDPPLARYRDVSVFEDGL